MISIDRRVQRTRALLRSAILDLIRAGRPYDDLTIEEITEQANLGRTTFYLHYEDKRSLLQDSVFQLVEDVFAEIYSEERVKRWVEENKDPRQYMFQFAAQNRELFSLLFTGQISGLVMGYFQQRLSKAFIERMGILQQTMSVAPRVPNEMNAAYAAGAVTGLLAWWVREGYPGTPEEIYREYYTLMREGTAHGSGLT